MEAGAVLRNILLLLLVEGHWLLEGLLAVVRSALVRCWVLLLLIRPWTLLGMGTAARVIAGELRSVYRCLLTGSHGLVVRLGLMVSARQLVGRG